VYVLSPRRVYEFPSKLLGRRDGAENEGSRSSTSVLSNLSQTISAGDYRLDPILVSITETARKLTAATGAAIAMRKEDRIVCVARTGEGVPPLGSTLSPDSGISGQCLRSGLIQNCAETQDDTRVDAELCKILGLRSIAVVPIRGWEAVNGVLTVVSGEAFAFNDQHIVHLQELAALAERARASLPKAAASVPAGRVKSAEPSIPLSERIVEFFANSKRNQVVLLAGVAIAALLMLAIWLGRRSSTETSASAAPAAAAPSTSPIPTDTPAPASSIETTSKGRQKPSAGAPVKLASQVQVLPRTTERSAEKSSPGKIPASNDSTEVVVRHSPVQGRPVDTASLEPPPVVEAEPRSSAIANVTSPVAPVPKFTAPISQVANGHLIYKVDPIYPTAAREMRMQGNVVLSAEIKEDGTVENVKLVRGEPLLAGAAITAVRRWRYSPYQLNNKPVKVPTEITVEFKLP
jgi:TonB family protein